MDKRIEKTKMAISSAFMTLRAEKPLNKITIKELCDLANINKSTFYTHYHDLYDLSKKLQQEAMAAVIYSIPQNANYGLSNPELFTREITLSFQKYSPTLKVLFAGEPSTFSMYLEKAIKQAIFTSLGESANTPELNILLSYCIHGAYHAQISNPDIENDVLLSKIEQIVTTLRPLFHNIKSAP